MFHWITFIFLTFRNFKVKKGVSDFALHNWNQVD